MNSYASAIRSLASSVNLPPNIKAEVFILVSSKEKKEESTLLAKERDLLATLAKSSKVMIV